jgi:hypothetical protein
MKFDSDFKKALSQLPSEEKDKLILRLLKHDLELANRLTFELLSTQSVQERRKEMEVRVKKQVARMTAHYYSPGELLMDMRDLSGEITGHVKITRDRIGEPALNLLMLNEVLNGASDRVAQEKSSKSHTFCTYVIARTFRTLLQIKSLDADWLIDFEDGLKELGRRIGNNPALIRTAIHNGLNVNWLLRPDKIPDDIAAIHKNLRTQGFLK